MDSFGCDPNTGEGMLATAERVAAQGGFSKAEVDAVTARRWEQYEQALDGFQKRWMVPITRPSADEIDADWGIRPAPLETLEGLQAVTDGGVVSYGSQTHPADGCAGLVVTSEPAEVEILASPASPAWGAGRCRRRPCRRRPPRSRTRASGSPTST